MRLATRSWIALALAVAAPRGARADSATADRLQAEAEALAAGKDFAGAAGKFHAAYAADPRPELLCDIGVAYYKQPDLSRAQRYLKQCVDAGASLDHDFLERVTSALRATEELLGKGAFTPIDFLVQPASATIRIDGWSDGEAIASSRRVWLPFGQYAVAVHAEGFADKALDVTAASRDVQVLRVVLEPRATTPEPVPTPVPVHPPPEVPSHPAPVPAPARASRIPAIAVGAGALGVAIAGTVFYASAASRAHDADTAHSMDDWQVVADSVHLRERVAFALWGAAGVGAAASVYLWHRASRAPVIEVAPTAGGAAVSLRGRF